MITLQNITNAFVRLEHDGRVFLSDPWISDGIFDGGWSPFPPIRDPEAALARCDYLFISHIHEDHFDLRALERLPRTCQVALLDMFPNDVMRKHLERLGFARVTMLPPFTPYEMAPDLTIEVIPPMNMFAQEMEYYRKGLKSVAVDAGALVTWNGLKLILLNDDSPYDQSILTPHLERLRHADLLALNYNGAADDYPVCYRNLSDEEKIELSDRRDQKKFEVTRELIALLQPKAVMPYSSEFSVRGRQARAFARIKKSLYNDRTKLAAALEQATGVPAVVAYEADRLEIRPDGLRKIAGPASTMTLAERAEQLHWTTPNYADRFPDVPGEAMLRELAGKAADHMFRFMDRLNLKSDWVFAARFDEGARPVVIDLRARLVLDELPVDRKTLTCFTDARYLGALFRRQAHWNNAMISYNLEWERRPNEYDPFLYDAVNFLHV